MMTYEVYVRKDYDHQPVRCDWLGHYSYRCGQCKKGYFKVSNEDTHAERCPECNGIVSIRRFYDDPFR